MKMDAVDEGVVGVITNHSWLDNPTFRGMRQSLMRSFDHIYVLDLHGNSRKKERSPDGSDDQNVFDIEQGVAISLLVKNRHLEKGVFHSEFWGKRLNKYKATAETSFKGVKWKTLASVPPFYLFVAQSRDLWAEYERGWPLPEIFPTHVLGFQTHRDHFAIAFERPDIEKRVRDFRDHSKSDSQLRETYSIADNSGWHLADARKRLEDGNIRAKAIIKCAYRPFDDRWCLFDTAFMDRPRRELLEHVAGRTNLCLLVPRQIGIATWRHAFVATTPAESCLVSSDTKSQNYVFPARTSKAAANSQENFSADFRAFIDSRYEHHYTPEEILGYIYAVLHAPTYCARYAGFLRIDFPSVPFPDLADDFETLSGLGWALVQAHLLRELPRQGLATYHGKGGHTVEAVRYSPEEQAIAINQSQFFKPVPQAAWDFHIGGYQVLDKYLKSRKGRVLSLDEINHVSAIADSLAFTIEQMARIGEAYRAAFPDRG
jgi:predicted helicase